MGTKMMKNSKKVRTPISVRNAKIGRYAFLTDLDKHLDTHLLRSHQLLSMHVCMYVCGVISPDGP